MSGKTIKVRNGVIDAFATSKGITVSSTKFNGTQKISAQVYYDEQGKIETRTLNQSIGVTHRDSVEKNSNFDACIGRVTLTSWIISLAIIITIISLGNTLLSIHAITFLIFSLLTKAYSNVPGYIADVYFARKNSSFSRYHSAEHMASKAAIRVNCAPTMDEILRETRFDVLCTTVKSIYFMLTSLINTLILTFSTIWIAKFFITLYQNTNLFVMHMILSIAIVAIIFAIMYLLRGVNKLISKLVEKEWFVKIFQSPLLKVPTERELSLAREAFKLQHRIDREILRNFECYETIGYSFDANDKTVVYETADGKFYKGTIDEYIQFVKNISSIKPPQEE